MAFVSLVRKVSTHQHEDGHRHPTCNIDLGLAAVIVGLYGKHLRLRQ